MVVISFFDASEIIVMHDRVAFPSISTVQAPHWPSPQPYLVPVMSRSSRNTLSRLRSGSASILRRTPLTWSSVTLVMSISGIFRTMEAIISKNLFYRDFGAGMPLLFLHGGWGYSLYPFDFQ